MTPIVTIEGPVETAYTEDRYVVSHCTPGRVERKALTSASNQGHNYKCAQLQRTGSDVAGLARDVAVPG